MHAARWLTAVDDVLKPSTTAERDIGDHKQIRRILVLFVVLGLVYGAVMGSYDAGGGIRLRQAFYSAVKVPLLFSAVFSLSLPSFFVINTLAGLRDDFHLVLKALLKTQAGISIILASLAPITALWYASSSDYSLAIVFNLAMFTTASLGGQLLLHRRYTLLLRRHRRHATMLRVWLVIYGFVGVQMAWVGRPFIGSPNATTHFFREGAWSNAYVHLANIVTEVFRTLFGQ